MTKLRVWNPWGITPRDFYDFDETLSMDDIQLDVFEEGDNVVAKLRAGGFGNDAFDVRIEGNMLTISGTYKSEEEEKEKGRKYYRKEIKMMSFTRSTELPSLVDGDKAEAVYKDGVLTVTLPKREEAKPKKIGIKVM